MPRTTKPRTTKPRTTKAKPAEPPLPAFRLTIELVPEPCWYANMRKAMSTSQWDRLRRQVYAEYDHKCEVCGVHPEQLNCHERWSYDDRKHVQRLEGFIALCDWCHHVKHIGLAGLLADEGRLDYEQLIAHFTRVNECSREAFEEYRKAAFKEWERRSRSKLWRTDLGAYAELVTLPPAAAVAAQPAAAQPGVSRDSEQPGTGEGKRAAHACFVCGGPVSVGYEIAIYDQAARKVRHRFYTCVACSEKRNAGNAGPPVEVTDFEGYAKPIGMDDLPAGWGVMLTGYNEQGFAPRPAVKPRKRSRSPGPP
jgi:hypothetical protein